MAGAGAVAFPAQGSSDSVYTRGGVGEGARSYEGEYVRPAIWVDMSWTDLPKE